MIIYKCLECNTVTKNYYYIKKHKHNNIEMYCSFCNKQYKKGHYGKCFEITKLFILFI
jgi:hypothetical protein